VSATSSFMDSLCPPIRPTVLMPASRLSSLRARHRDSFPVDGIPPASLPPKLLHQAYQMKSIFRLAFLIDVMDM
jgi:hypothetical protein